MKKLRVSGFFVVIISICELIVLALGPFGMPGQKKVLSDLIFLFLVCLYLFWGYRMLRKDDKNRAFDSLPFNVHITELLLAAVIILFIFSYIYASNANMDYVQRFAAGKGNIRMAPDSKTERLNINAVAKYLVTLMDLIITYSVIDEVTGDYTVGITKEMMAKLVMARQDLGG